MKKLNKTESNNIMQGQGEYLLRLWREIPTDAQMISDIKKLKGSDLIPRVSNQCLIDRFVRLISPKGLLENYYMDSPKVDIGLKKLSLTDTMHELETFGEFVDFFNGLDIPPLASVTAEAYIDPGYSYSNGDRAHSYDVHWYELPKGFVLWALDDEWVQEASTIITDAKNRRSEEAGKIREAIQDHHDSVRALTARLADIEQGETCYG